MKYAFIELYDPKTQKVLYMEPFHFDYYSKKEPFRSNAVSLCLFDKIYVGCFPLMFDNEELFKFNPEAELEDRLPLSDIAFLKNSTNSVAKNMGAMNIYDK